MSNDDEKLNILDLPNEVLTEILAYVSDQVTVGQVCKTFYNISCRLKTYKLSIGFKKQERFPSVNLEEDVDIYESLLISDCAVISFRLRRVIDHIGANIRNLVIRVSCLNFEGTSLLNLMPNLEKLDLLYVTWGEVKNTHPVDFKLRLNKLKDLTIFDECDEILEAFDHLPDNVLNKLSVTSDNGDRDTLGKYFLNQRKIKHYVGDVVTKLTGLKLKTLQLCFDEEALKGTLNALRGQDELTSLDIWVFLQQHEELLNFICNELKALEEVELESFETETFVDLSKLQKLKNLKKLTFGGVDVESAKTIKSSSLMRFDCRLFPEEAHLFLAANCPNLRDLDFDTQYENFEIEQFIALCPKLERFRIRAKNLVFSEAWGNQCLKHLKMYFDELSENKFEFMKRCKSLKTVSIHGHVDTEALKRLLIENPNLTTLCLLYSGESEYAGIVMEHGNNIECYHQQLSLYRNYKEAYDKMAEAKNVLKDKLPVFRMVNDDYYGSLEFSLKKYGKIEKCCEELEKIWTNKIK